MKKQAFKLLILLLIFGTAMVSCGSEESTSVTERRYVKVERLGKKKNNEEMIFHGQLKENKEVNIAFKVGGQVYNVMVDEGDYVKKGQVIARIDPRDYKIQLQSATAQYKQIQSEYTRYKELYKKNKLPINTLEKMEAGFLSAKSAYEAAENALEDTELKAPFEGFVYRKKINKFENVAPGQPIYTLLDVSHLEVVFSLPESKVNKAKSFNDIRIDVPNAGVYGLKADVLSVNEKTNGNDMFDVRLLINSPDNKVLKSGMSAKVNIKLHSDNSDSVVVPVESVFYKEGKARVWIVSEKDLLVTSKAVVIDKIENEGMVTVTSGLTGEESVVVAGVYSLSENQPVKLLHEKL